MSVENGPGPSVAEEAVANYDAVQHLGQQLEEVQLGPDQNRIYAEFLTTQGPNNRVMCKAAVMYLEASHLPKPWKQKVNYKSFEAMHGLSRVTCLVPDKLATALAIFNEDLPDSDDGGFLIKLVIDLVVFYRGKLASQVLPEDSNEAIPRIEKLAGYGVHPDFKAPEETVGLVEVLNEFLIKMVSMQANLTMRVKDAVLADAHEILQMADDLLEFSVAFMDFVNPVCLNVERKGSFDENRVEELKFELNAKLDDNKKRLREEFDLLTKPKETEE